MATRLRRFASNISGITLTAFVVTSMSMHGHSILPSGQSDLRAGAPGVSRAVAVTHDHALIVTNVDFGGFSPSVTHHY